MSGGFSGWLSVLFPVRGFGQAVDEGLCGRAAVHVAALVGPALSVACGEVVENGLHLLDGLEPGPAPLDAEVLVEQGAVEGKRPLEAACPSRRLCSSGGVATGTGRADSYGPRPVLPEAPVR